MKTGLTKEGESSMKMGFTKEGESPMKMGSTKCGTSKKTGPCSDKVKL